MFVANSCTAPEDIKELEQKLHDLEIKCRSRFEEAETLLRQRVRGLEERVHESETRIVAEEEAVRLSQAEAAHLIRELNAGRSIRRNSIYKHLFDSLRMY